jgi:hypothetical protein
VHLYGNEGSVQHTDYTVSGNTIQNGTTTCTSAPCWKPVPSVQARRPPI